MHDADFLAEIGAAPHDAAPHLVYADALLRRGDPRGELVVVQHALEGAGAGAIHLSRREAELLDEHLEAWLGPAAAHRDSLIVRWRRGFLAGARVRLRQAAADVRPLRALLDAPEAAAALAELHLGPNKPEAASCQPLLDELGAHEARGLRRLHVGDGPIEDVWAAPSIELELDRLAARPLEALVVQAGSIELRGRAAPRLRELVLRSPALVPAQLLRVGAWPALESLSLWCAAPGPLADWLSPARFPRLRALALDGAANADALAAELRRLPIARQLEAIAITGGTLTEWGALALATMPRPPRLDLRRNNIAREACDALARRPGVTVMPQAGNVEPFTDRAALCRFRNWLDRSATEVWTRELGRGGDPDRALAAHYERGCAHWAEPRRLDLARTLKPGAARAVYLELERRWREGLAPRLRSEGGALYRKLAEACALAGALDEAEAWQWRAHQHARWYGWGDRDRRSLDEIATLRLRQGAVDAAIPLLDQLASATDDRRRVRRTDLVLSLSYAELARGRLARAEVVCRRAAEIAEDSAATAEPARRALAALLWARHDVESLARAAWLFAVRRRQLDPNARADAELHRLAPTEATAGTAVRRSLAMFERHDDAAGIALACALLGELAERRGQLAQADGWLDRALAAAPAVPDGEDARREPDVLARAIAHGVRARVALDRGALPRAAAEAREALAIFRAELCGLGEALQLLALADVALAAGRLDEAEAHAGQALALLEAGAEFPAAAAAHLRLGQIAQLRRDRAGAERRLRAAIACAERDRYLRARRPARSASTAGRPAAGPSAGPGEPPLRRELCVIGHAELWLAVLHAQDCRLREAYRLLGRARARLAAGRAVHAGRAQSAELLATATAILGLYAGSPLSLPAAQGSAARAMHGLLV